MTTTRATLPSPISSQYSKSHKQRQVIENNEKPQQATTNYTTDYGLQFRHAYDILNVPYERKETNRDYDGRISNSRRGRTNAQDIRGFSDTTPTTREDARIQDRRVVACRSERVTGVSGKEEKYSGQEIIKACNCRLSKKFVASILLSTGFQSLDNKLDLCYRCIHYKRCCLTTSSPAVLLSTMRQWVLCGGREDTHMSITIGTSPQSVYPSRTNSLYAIFDVHGSEVAA